LLSLLFPLPVRYVHNVQLRVSAQRWIDRYSRGKWAGASDSV
jgi:hypothetical protein